MKDILNYYFKKLPIKIKTELYGLKYKYNGNYISSYFNNKYDSVYFYHIKKTGGTSINKMFINLHFDNYNKYYKQLSTPPKFRIIKDGFSYCSWNKQQINSGKYNYAFSHHSFYKVNPPKDSTFTFTVFRDPLERIRSLYSMYLRYYKSGRSTINKYSSEHPGNNILDFIDKADLELIQNQLFMFSKNLDIDEALANVEKLNFYFFLDEFNLGINKMNSELGINLEPLHTRKSKNKKKLSEKTRIILEKKLKKEIIFYNKLRNERSNFFE